MKIKNIQLCNAFWNYLRRHYKYENFRKITKGRHYVLLHMSMSFYNIDKRGDVSPDGKKSPTQHKLDYECVASPLKRLVFWWYKKLTLRCWLCGECTHTCRDGRPPPSPSWGTGGDGGGRGTLSAPARAPTRPCAPRGTRLSLPLSPSLCPRLGGKGNVNLRPLSLLK